MIIEIAKRYFTLATLFNKSNSAGKKILVDGILSIASSQETNQKLKKRYLSLQITEN